MVEQWIEYTKMAQKMQQSKGGDRDHGDKDGGDHHSTGGMNGNPIETIANKIAELEGNQDVMDTMRAAWSPELKSQVFGDIESLFDNAHEMAMIFDEEDIVRFTQRFKDLP